MYSPSSAELAKLGFQPWQQTQGIWYWKGKKASIWLALLPPGRLALSTSQYERGDLHETDTLTKKGFWLLLLPLAPELATKKK